MSAMEAVGITSASSSRVLLNFKVFPSDHVALGGALGEFLLKIGEGVEELDRTFLHLQNEAVYPVNEDVLAKTVGMATVSPAAVVMRDWEMPPATTWGSPRPLRRSIRKP